MISFADNIDAFGRGLSDLSLRQIPFAAALALNDTAADVQKAWETQAERRLDRPTPFTKRGVYVQRAKKGRLTATVGYRRIQVSYLRFQVQGGARRPAGRALVIPVGQKRNVYGNMPKGAVKRALAKKDVFSGKVGGKPGIYRRPSKRQRKMGKGPQLLMTYASRASYSPTLDLQRPATGTARAQFPKHFARRFRQALATAR